ncbi:MAG: DMT family transporter [Lentilitoribacter sp.]
MNEKPRNFLAGTWLLADMCLNIWALTIVKAIGLDYTAWQMVFIRAVIGLVMMLPWIYQKRDVFVRVEHMPLHCLRVVLSTLTLTTSFFAISRLPFALFSAINFTRPLVLMALAAIILRESISGKQWIAGLICLIGVVIALEPAGLQFNWGVPVLLMTVVLGTLAIIVTRKLSKTPTVIMMTFYTVGLSILSAPFALWSWTTTQASDLYVLLAIGFFAQSAQFCFLQAHKWGEAGFLALLGYSSLLLTTAVGYFIFDEIPTFAFTIGAILIVIATVWATFSPRQTNPKIPLEGG